MKLVNDIRIEHIKKGKKPPSCAKITKAIMKKYKIKKEDLLYDQFIKI